MTNNVHINIDDAVFGYDVDIKVDVRQKGRRWFELMDGRVGQEHEIEQGVTSLLEAVRVANGAAGGKGYVNDFDFMLRREMSERPDLLLMDKPKVDAAIQNRLKEVMPGLDNLKGDLDTGLLLTAYGRLAHERGKPRPQGKSLMDRLRAKMADRIMPSETLMEVAKAAVTYLEEIRAGSLEFDSDRAEVIRNTVSQVHDELQAMGMEPEKVRKLQEVETDLEIEAGALELARLV